MKESNPGKYAQDETQNRKFQKQMIKTGRHMRQMQIPNTKSILPATTKQVEE